MQKSLFAAAALFCLAPVALGQSPDGRGEVVLDVPVYRGVKADVPIPPELHLRNEGGSDGAGLCVITSLLINGRYQGIPALADGKASRFWKLAKSRPGGYYPEKLERYLDELRETMPGVRWISWEGKVTDLIESYTRRGVPVACTTNTGALYGYQSIHHYITVAHLDADLACLIDNNDPGKYHWMPRAEFDRRFVDGLQGWLFIWIWDTPGGGSDPLWLAALLVACSAALVTVGAKL
jgi:hypothetical protein